MNSGIILQQKAAKTKLFVNYFQFIQACSDRLKT